MTVQPSILDHSFDTICDDAAILAHADGEALRANPDRRWNAFFLTHRGTRRQQFAITSTTGAMNMILRSIAPERLHFTLAG